MRYILFIVLITMFLSTADSVWAQNLSPGTETVLPGEESSEELDMLPDDATLLGEVEENGIVAIAWLYRAPSVAVETEQQKQSPYLLFLRFLSVESNIAVEKGLVAYKLENDEGVATPATKMEFKNGYFVDGLERPTPGRYVLHIGSKLEDEKKRQYQYDLVIR